MRPTTQAVISARFSALRFVRHTWAVVLFLLLCPFLFGQDTGLITGTVTDASGAVLSNASALIANQDTGSVRQGKTKQAGEFLAPALEPGCVRDGPRKRSSQGDVEAHETRAGDRGTELASPRHDAYSRLRRKQFEQQSSGD